MLEVSTGSTLDEIRWQKIESEHKRQRQICNKVDWDNLSLDTTNTVDSYPEEERKIILEEAFRRLKVIKNDLNKEKEYSKRLSEERQRIKKRYKICECCDKKSIGAYKDSSYRYCAKHMKEVVRLNNDLAPMTTRALITAAKFVAKERKKST